MLHDPDGTQQLCSFVAHRFGVEQGRRFHGDRRRHLQQVVLDHVAKGACFLIISPASLHADRLGGRDLNIVDVTPVPHRLEDAVAEPEGQDILHRLFAEVMVDAIHLVLVEYRVDLLVQCRGARQVAPERLFNDDPPPALPARELCTPDSVHHRRVITRLRRKIKQHVAAGLVRRLDLCKTTADSVEHRGIVDIAGHIVQALCEAAPQLGVKRAVFQKLRYRFAHLLAEVVV